MEERAERVPKGEEEKKKEYIRQCALVREFDQKLRKCTSNGMEPVYALGKGVYIVLVAMVLSIPFEIDELSTIVACVIGPDILPVYIFLSGYLYVNENGKMQSISEKLKYMPVDIKVIRHMRMEYLVKFLKLPLIIAIIAQITGAWLCNHTITIANILYPVIVMGVYPLLIGCADIYSSKYN